MRKRYFAEIDRQHPLSSVDEVEAVVDEAIRSVRPGYTPDR
jgi:hypothetical protein